MTVSTSIELDEALEVRLQHLARMRDVSPHQVLKEAVEQYVEREEERDASRRDAARAWSTYKRTGLHLTFEEADAWLSKLETGEDIEPPECHV